MRPACSRRRSRPALAFLVAFVVLHLALGTASTTSAAPPQPWRPVAPEAHRAPLPRDPSNEAARLARLGERFRIESTAHFSIAVHEETPTATYRGKILEDVHAAFTRLCDELGLPLRRPDAAHALVFTPTRDRFVEIAGIPTLPEEVDGLYLHERREGLFFEPLGRREVRAAHTRGRRLQGDLTALRRRIAARPTGSTITLRFRRGPDRDLSRHDALELVDDEIRRMRQGRAATRYDQGQWSLETMTHEAAHQLSFEMGLFSTHVPPPLWLTEGFATLFEPSRNGFLLETRKPNWRRWSTLDARHREGRRTALRDLLADDSLLRRFETGSHAYADAWSLVYFLVVEEPEGFARYVEALRSASARPGRASRIEGFEAAVGAPIDEIEARWRRFVDELGQPTPN